MLIEESGVDEGFSPNPGQSPLLLELSLQIEPSFKTWDLGTRHLKKRRLENASMTTHRNTSSSPQAGAATELLCRSVPIDGWWEQGGRCRLGGGPSCSSPSSPDIFPRRHITPTHAHTTKQRAGLPSLSPSQISTLSNGSGNFAASLLNQGAPRTPPDSTVTVAYDGEDGTPPRLSCYV